MILSCYAEDKPGQWGAFCLDFDLAVQGESFEDVYRDLKIAIEMYLEYVEGLPAEERDSFLQRKAPLSLRLGFLWFAIRSTLFGKSENSDKSHAEFLLPCRV